MKKKQKIIYVIGTISFLLIFVLLGIENSYQQTRSELNEGKKNPFVINLSLSKKSLIEGESVWITVTFKNTGNSIDSLKILNQSEVASGLRIYNQASQPSKFWEGVQDYLSYSYTKFNPEEEVTFYFELQICCGFKELEHAKGFYAYFPAGEYKVISFFNYEHSGKIEKIQSKEISFKVTEPSGKEKEEFEQLIEAYRLPHTSKIQDKENKINAFNKFIQLNPDSKYLEIALNHSSLIKSISGICYDSSLILQVGSFLEKNPESYMSERLIYYSADIITKNYGGIESAFSYLESIKNKLPNTRAFSGADNLIKTKMYTENKKGN